MTKRMRQKQRRKTASMWKENTKKWFDNGWKMEKGLKTKLCSKKRENGRWWWWWRWWRWGVQVTSGFGGLVEREKWYEYRAHTFISFKLYLRALFDFLNSCVLYYVGIITWKIFDMIVKTSETNCVWKGDFSAILFFCFIFCSLFVLLFVLAWHGMAWQRTLRCGMIWYVLHEFDSSSFDP